MPLRGCQYSSRQIEHGDGHEFVDAEQAEAEILDGRDAQAGFVDQEPLDRVEVGDTLFGIALKYSTTVDAIMALNPQITNRNIVFEGQEIKIP